MRPYLLLLVASFVSAAAIPPQMSHQANPLGIFWDDSFTNIEDYSRAGALVVAGNCNRYDPRFVKAREQGAEVLAYLNVIEVYDHMPCKLNQGFYMGGPDKVPKWPWPSYGERINWPNTHLVDMRAGSVWANHVVEYVTQLMRENKVDGVFLDNVGARLWTRAHWKEWPQQEQDAWTEGNIDIVRRIDEQRRKINPRFIVVTNNLWDLGGGNKKGFEGERYIDGVVIEHPKLNEYHRWYGGRTFSDLGHRRVLVIALNEEDVEGWSHVPGVTHVTWQKNYSHPEKPEVPFTALTDRH